jgi:small conductance mechanosensitive channel
MNLDQAPEKLGAAAAMSWAWATTFLPRLATAILILIAGFVIAGWVARIVRGIVERSSHIDNTVEPILGTAARYSVLILFLIAALGQIGVQTASLLAVLGAAGLAIGLALQGTLQNIAAGIMLIYLRPFRAGDSIETSEVAGTVKEIGLFVTHLDTGDGLFFFVPNSTLWNKPLKNYSRNPRRMMTIQIGIGYRSDPAEARRVLLEMAASEPRLLKDPAPSVFVDKYADSGIVMNLQGWAATGVYADVQRTLTEEAKHRLEAANIEVPSPQRIVQVFGRSEDDKTTRPEPPHD